MNELTPSQINELYRSITFTIDAAETPELVPLHIKVNHFLNLYGRAPGIVESLNQNLTDSDRKLLLEFATEGRRQFEKDHERIYLVKRKTLICAQAQEASVVRLAALLDQFTQEHEERYVARYDALLKSLSSSGEKVVREFISQKIKPRISRASWIALAAKSPSFFREQVLADCAELDIPARERPGANEPAEVTVQDRRGVPPPLLRPRRLGVRVEQCLLGQRLAVDQLAVLDDPVNTAQVGDVDQGIGVEHQ